MNDPPGVPSPLGIEVVEWFSEGGENLTVRVTGRWRRRRPAWSAQPTLVIEAPGRRYRFPAMPEPPSLSGTPPGMWRISFAVPAALAPDLGGRAWLQFGAVVVPLPAAVEPLGAADDELSIEPAPEPSGRHPEPATETPGEEEPTAERPLPSAELEAETARRRASEAEQAADQLRSRVQTLESELDRARAEVDKLSGSLTDLQVARRAAEQRAHAERAQSLELANKLAEQERDTDRARQALGELATAEERVRELELELAGARRRIDEADHTAVSAKAARDRAQRVASETAEELDRVRTERRVGEAPAKLARLLSLEHALTARRADAAARVPDEPPPPPAVESQQARAGPGAEALVAALRAELDHRAGAEAVLRARLLDAEARLGARQLLDGRTATTLGLLREELDGLRAVLGRERAGRLAAEQRAGALERELGPLRRRTREAHQAVGELRAVLEELRAAESARVQEQAAVEEAVVAEPDAPAVEPADEAPAVRLSEALERLRDDIAPLDADQPASQTPDREPERPATETRPWLRPVFRWLTEHEPEQAGRLLVDLLPAQRAVAPEPVAYDLMLGGDAGCMRVSVDEAGSRVVHDDAPRQSREVDFQVFGGYAALAGMVTASPLKRRFGRGVARVRGRRKRVASLDALIDVRLGLKELYEAGVRMRPRTILTVLARVIEPGWTEGVRFALAYEVPPEPAVYLIVGDGGRINVSDDAPDGPVATRVSGPSGALELLLTGNRGDDTVVIGDDRPLTLLGKWIKLAQSGVNVGGGHR